MSRDIGWGSYPIERKAGYEFQRIPLREWRKHMQEAGLATFPPSELEVEGTILVPFHKPDEKMRFPGEPRLEDAGVFVKSGIAQHQIWSRVNGHVLDFGQANMPGFSATQIDDIFVEDSWYGECFGVLDAHGWTKAGSLDSDLLQRVKDVEGEEIESEARKRFGNEWQPYILEIAAKHFAEPLSRLWYAANMESLYYCHHDDIRLGYLWCEYRMKMRYELFALKHLEVLEKNRESGQKGGQGDKKKERYTTLDSLALARVHDLAFAKDKDCIRIARQLAAKYDREHPDNPLFSMKHRALSQAWFDDWLQHFRELVRKAQLNQHIVG